MMLPPAISRQLPRLHLIPQYAAPIARLQQTIRSASRRNVSTQSATEAASTRTRNFLIGTTLLAGGILGYFYATDTRASYHQWATVPLLRFFVPDAEEAHVAGNKALKSLYKFGLHPRERGNSDALGDLEVEVFGHTLANPIGTSAGLDKGAEIIDPILAIGPAIVEVGGVTYEPQEGNPKPRVFRLPSQNALINRYGLNSEGAEVVANRLHQRVREYAYSNGLGSDENAVEFVLNGGAGVPAGSLAKSKLLAIQIAKNKLTPDDNLDEIIKDHVKCVEAVGRYADFLVVNVSSPNTPGLRELQRHEPLVKLLKGVVAAASNVDRRDRPAVMVKISPDEDSDEQIISISNAIWESGVQGIVVANTTKTRPPPSTDLGRFTSREITTLQETGGFSGPHLFEKTLSLVKRYRHHLDKGISQSSQASPLPSVEGTEGGTKLELPSTDSTVATVPTGERGSSSTDPSVPKVIFASGGITNGKQVLGVLNAGATVAQVYTALTYGGAGTITRLKQQMRKEIERPK